MMYCKINVLYPTQKTLKENKRESDIELTDKKLLFPEGMEFKSIEYDEDTDFEFDDTCFFRVRTKNYFLLPFQRNKVYTILAQLM